MEMSPIKSMIQGCHQKKDMLQKTFLMKIVISVAIIRELVNRWFKGIWPMSWIRLIPVLIKNIGLLILFKNYRHPKLHFIPEIANNNLLVLGIQLIGMKYLMIKGFLVLDYYRLLLHRKESQWLIVIFE